VNYMYTEHVEMTKWVFDLIWHTEFYLKPIYDLLCLSKYSSSRTHLV